jgi:hypothetical protein
VDHFKFLEEIDGVGLGMVGKKEYRAFDGKLLEILYAPNNLNRFDFDIGVWRLIRADRRRFDGPVCTG